MSYKRIIKSGWFWAGVVMLFFSALFWLVVIVIPPGLTDWHWGIIIIGSVPTVLGIYFLIRSRGRQETTTEIKQRPKALRHLLTFFLVSVSLLALSLMILITLFMLGPRDPIAPIRVENQTDQTLSIYVRFGTVNETYHMGDVEAGSEIKNEHAPIGISSVYYIEAKNIQGEVVYYRKFGGQYLIDADWKIVIPPLP